MQSTDISAEMEHGTTSFCLGLQSIKLLTQLTNKPIYSVYSALFAICPLLIFHLEGKKDGIDSVEGQKSCF